MAEPRALSSGAHPNLGPTPIRLGRVSQSPGGAIGVKPIRLNVPPVAPGSCVTCAGELRAGPHVPHAHLHAPMQIRNPGGASSAPRRQGASPNEDASDTAPWVPGALAPGTDWNLVSRAGLEPATDGLKAHCSTN